MGDRESPIAETEIHLCCANHQAITPHLLFHTCNSGMLHPKYLKQVNMK